MALVMKAKTLNLLYEWIKLVMYIICANPAVGQDDRDALGDLTKKLLDQLRDNEEAR